MLEDVHVILVTEEQENCVQHQEMFLMLKLFRVVERVTHSVHFTVGKGTLLIIMHLVD